jgi:hypothetical protein
VELSGDEDFEMTAVEVQGRNAKLTWKIVVIYRIPNKGM